MNLMEAFFLATRMSFCTPSPHLCAFSALSVTQDGRETPPLQTSVKSCASEFVVFNVHNYTR